jgi:hypothetical protein
MTAEGFALAATARPGMTWWVNSFQQTLPLTPTLSPQAGRGRKGAATVRYSRSYCY